MPDPTVLATCRPKNRKAMKLNTAAQNTATLGDRTRVETMVAMELAASCMPFRKSNSRATATRDHNVMETASTPLKLLDQDAADPVGDVLEPVDHLFQMVQHLGPGDEGHGLVLIGLEQGLHARVIDLVRAV